jgi:uncharacterized phage protein (TIGR02220 family)
MPGRIRTIKPELLEDDKTAALTHEEWRLFVSLLLLADDHGCMRAHPVQLAAAVFWARESREGLAKLLEGLASVSLITLYTVRGQEYLHVTNWTKHQKVDHPGQRRVPGPDEADSREPREKLASDSREPRDSLAPDLRPPTSDHDLSCEAEASPGSAPTAEIQTKSPGAAARAATDTVLALLNDLAGRRYTASAPHVELIKARLAEGATVADLLAVVERKASEWKADPPLVPDGARVMAWVKGFAAFKRNVSVAYAWEPVIVKPARKPVVSKRLVMRDWVE